ncbi:MAG: winged helix-turn-helix domain-containing protein [Conexivisphaerales archaeon]
MKKVLLLDESASRLLYDPLNLKIVRILLQREMSTSELSRKIQAPVVRVWRRLGKLKEAGIIEVRKVVKVGNLEKKIWGASALRYVPSDLFAINLSDPRLKAAYELFLELQKKLAEQQNSLQINNVRNKSPLDLFIFTDLLAFVNVMEMSDTAYILKRIKFHLQQFMKEIDFVKEAVQ